MKTHDLTTWVSSAKDDHNKRLRQAIHTVLYAIGLSDYLRLHMAMKGGILLAIRYDSSRYTKDIDFSTGELFSGFDTSKLISEIDKYLAAAVDDLPYSLDCRFQSYKIQPGIEGTFQTLEIKIGYAKYGTPAHKRLLKKNCSDVLEIDYSFNEVTAHIEDVKLSEGIHINAYSEEELIAEKYRAILQQKFRNRKRRQDSYDLFRLLQRYPVSKEQKKIILKSLIDKSRSRGINPSKSSLDDVEIISRSRSEYDSLKNEIEEELPEFTEVFTSVKRFFESLPW